MPKIVSVLLLVNEDDENAIVDGLNDALREITHPMGSGNAENSFILDYSLPLNLIDVAPGIAQAITNKDYEEGSAFGGGQAQDHYLLIMEGDVTPVLEGPFGTDAERLQRAREYRAGSDQDGVYRLDVPAGISPDVAPFTGNEIDGIDDLMDALITCLRNGDRDIARLRVPGPGFFTFRFEGEEVVLTPKLAAEAAVHMYENLVVFPELTQDVVMTMEQATQRFGRDDWVKEVQAGKTSLGIDAWAKEKAGKLAIFITKEGGFGQSQKGGA